MNPYAPVYTGGDWQLIGHCHLRNAPRTFRVDRVARMKVAGRPGTADFERPPGFSVATYVQRSPWVFQAGAAGDAMDVVLDVGPERAWMAEEDFGPGATRDAHDDGWTRVTFRTGNPHYVITRILDACGHMRVIAPVDLRAGVYQIAADVATLYKDRA